MLRNTSPSKACITSFVFALTLVLAPHLTLAQPPMPPCDFPGCGMAPSNVIVGAAIPTIARILLNAVAALALIFVLVGGARLVLNFGKEDAFEKAKKAIMWAAVGLVIALTSHRIVIAVISQPYVVDGTFVSAGGFFGNDPVFEFFTTIVNIMATLLNFAFLLAILVGGIRMVTARGKQEDVSKGRKSILYAIAGVVIINVAPFVIKAIIAI